MDLLLALQTIIRRRRSVKPADMNGRIIENAQIMQLLELANWAPTHGRTEPWRFVVYSSEAKTRFCSDHAEMYKANTDPEKYTEAKYDKLQQQGDTLSHIIIVYMKRTVNHAVPAIEEIAAASAAAQNILLGAEAMGIAVLWSTGGMIHHEAMKTYLSLKEEDQVLGMLMLGYTDKPLAAGKRSIPLAEKVLWK